MVEKLKQRFLDEVDGTTTTWYSGTVIDYSDHEKTHRIKYEGESEHCDFYLTLDLNYEYRLKSVNISIVYLVEEHFVWYILLYWL